MSFIINTNMMAYDISRTLNGHYANLSASTERLSSGLRINGAEDDAAGYAISQRMHSEMAVLEQGKRNANDAISLIQTADGALGVIDEKLIRMKELAEQASTGSYDEVQRSIINEEYQAMASEITRIANATDFNGIKLLDGALAKPHDGSVTVSSDDPSASGALKIQFGTGNDSAEDYFFIEISDATAGALGVGSQAGVDSNSYAGDSQTAKSLKAILEAHKANETLTKTQVASLNAAWENDKSKYLDKSTGEEFESLHAFVNASYKDGGLNSAIKPDQLAGTANIDGTKTLEMEALVTSIEDAPTAVKAGTGAAGTEEDPIVNPAVASESYKKFEEIVAALPEGAWAMSGEQGKELAEAFEKDKEKFLKPDGTEFANFAEFATTSAEFGGLGLIMNSDNFAQPVGGTTADGTLVPPNDDPDAEPPAAVTSLTAEQVADLKAKLGKVHSAFSLEPGNNILTQNNAQIALGALDDAIDLKDMNRARLGGMQNRLENTMSNLTIQHSSLQTAESRVSDSDYSLEMTLFTRNQILSQGAVAMLTQANSIPEMALQLFNG